MIVGSICIKNTNPVAPKDETTYQKWEGHYFYDGETKGAFLDTLHRWLKLEIDEVGIIESFTISPKNDDGNEKQNVGWPSHYEIAFHKEYVRLISFFEDDFGNY